MDDHFDVMTKLLLLRHGKSSWQRPFINDIDRPLNRRGHCASKKIAKYIYELGFLPDFILCSPARRTRETLGHVTPAFAHEYRILLEPKLYSGGAIELLDCLLSIGDGCNSAMLIGHNPGISELSNLILNTGPRDQVHSIKRKFPTGGLAVFNFNVPWSDLGPASADLQQFVLPKSLKSNDS